MSGSPNASTAHLVPKSTSTGSSAPPPKDFSAAFGNLQSAYGSGGHAPSLVPKKPPKVKANPQPEAKSPSSASTSQPAASQPVSPSTGSPPPKNVGSVFGKLASTYGFGKGVPVLKGKTGTKKGKEKEKKNEKKESGTSAG